MSFKLNTMVAIKSPSILSTLAIFCFLSSSFTLADSETLRRIQPFGVVIESKIVRDELLPNKMIITGANGGPIESGELNVRLESNNVVTDKPVTLEARDTSSNDELTLVNWRLQSVEMFVDGSDSGLDLGNTVLFNEQPMLLGETLQSERILVSCQINDGIRDLQLGSFVEVNVSISTEMVL